MEQQTTEQSVETQETEKQTSEQSAEVQAAEQQTSEQQKTEQPQAEAKQTEPKPKKKYTAVVTEESENGAVRTIRIGEKLFQSIAIAAAVLVVMAVGGLIYGMTATNAVKSENAVLTTEVGNLAYENSQLTAEKEALSEKVLLLSETVNQKVKAEAEAVEKAIPSGFPLAGIATVLEEAAPAAEADAETEDTDTEAEEGTDEQPAEENTPAEPMIIFEAAKGNSVIASGSGKISEITEDETWGKTLKIDHGNGYVSVYRVNAEPKVKAEDEITKGTLLFEITNDTEKIGYQIMQDDAYIDPMELLEISG